MTAVRGAPRPGLAEMPMLPPGFMYVPDGTTMQGAGTDRAQGVAVPT